jgi:hypothetical protein
LAPFLLAVALALAVVAMAQAISGFPWLHSEQTIGTEAENRAENAASQDRQSDQIAADVSRETENNKSDSTCRPPCQNAPEGDESLWMSLEFWLGLFTFMLVVVGGLQYKQLRRTVDSSEQSNRAYLELGHEKPGIFFVNGQPTVQLKIRNVGQTPCHIEDSVVGFAPCPRPLNGKFPPPEYGAFAHPYPNQGYLVRDGYIFISPNFPEGTEWPWDEINNGTQVLVTCGYVEYTDAFGKVHHAGWGRYYEPGNEKSPAGNLSYIPDKAYNYDRPKGG